MARAGPCARPASRSSRSSAAPRPGQLSRSARPKRRERGKREEPETDLPAARRQVEPAAEPREGQEEDDDGERQPQRPARRAPTTGLRAQSARGGRAVPSRDVARGSCAKPLRKANPAAGSGCRPSNNAPGASTRLRCLPESVQARHAGRHWPAPKPHSGETLRGTHALVNAGGRLKVLRPRPREGACGRPRRR